MRRQFRRDARHEVFERGVDYVRLERPDDFVAVGLRTVRALTSDCGQEGREARVGDNDETLFQSLLLRLLHQNRLALRSPVAEGRGAQRVVGRDGEEGVARRAPDLTHARDVAQRALRLRQQTLDDERRQIVLKHNVLEVAVKLHNRRIRATDWRQLARVLCEKGAVECEHRKSQTEKDGDSRRFKGCTKVIITSAEADGGKHILT